MMLFRLSQAAVAQRLEEITPQLAKTMQGVTVTKDTVKQDLERACGLQRSALQAVAALCIISTWASMKFDLLVENVKRNVVWTTEFKEHVG